MNNIWKAARRFFCGSKELMWPPPEEAQAIIDRWITLGEEGRAIARTRFDAVGGGTRAIIAYAEQEMAKKENAGG